MHQGDCEGRFLKSHDRKRAFLQFPDYKRPSSKRKRKCEKNGGGVRSDEGGEGGRRGGKSSTLAKNVSDPENLVGKRNRTLLKS